MRTPVPSLFLLLAACATQPQAVAPPPAVATGATALGQPATAYPPACAVQFPPNPRIAAWSADKFVGSYASGPLRLSVRRVDNHLLIEQPGGGPTQINTDSAESWNFADGCGTRYAFMLPPDGPGAWLTITTARFRSEWHRSGY